MDMLANTSSNASWSVDGLAGKSFGMTMDEGFHKGRIEKSCMFPIESDIVANPVLLLGFMEL